MEEYRNKGFVFIWKIKNFSFCWHKTGEYLASPLFTIDSPYKTSWRLWLYPRGEDDGEYISYYLIRDEGGPTVVKVDFLLYLLVDDFFVKKGVLFSKIYSFKYHQREGLKCFAPRWRAFAPVAAKNDRFTLIAGCRILHVDNTTSDPFVYFTQTTVISTYSLRGIEMLDCNSSLAPIVTKDIEVKPLLEEEPLLNINVSYLKKCLVVTIKPKRCKKIRYAVLKISIVQLWLGGFPIQNIRTWIGEIETDIWKYYIPQLESVTAGVQPGDHKSFLLCYDFAFSTGNTLTEKEGPVFDVLEWKTAKLNGTKYSSPSALSALQGIRESQSYINLDIVTKTGCLFVHKAFVSARSAKLMSLLTKRSRMLPFRATGHDISEKFFSFMYTDTLGLVSFHAAHHLHILSEAFKLELLKEQSATHLKNCLDIDNASVVLYSSESGHNSNLKNFAMNYIMIYSEDIFPSSEWNSFLKSKPELAMQSMLMKYKTQMLPF